MKVRVEVPGERNYYSNDDSVLAEITVDRDGADADEEELASLRAALVCEGAVPDDDGKQKRIEYFAAPGRLERTHTSHEQWCYRCVLTFPSESSEYPSTLRFDDAPEGIEWHVKVEGRTAGGVILQGKRVLTFMQAGPLPNLLNLVDIEHAEIIDGMHLDLITSHATAGLPQSPLTAGIGLCVECSHPRAFVARRLRLLLLDTTEVNFGHRHRFLPTHRWLLSSTTFEPPIPLEHSTLLDEYTRDVKIDHASLPQSFECNEFAHSFDLAVELSIESVATHKGRRVMSISPVVVLPRIAHTFDADELSRIASSDIAYITDSSDDEDDGAIDALTHAFLDSHKGDHAYPQSSASSASIRSIFSDHTTKLDAEHAGIPAITFS